MAKQLFRQKSDPHHLPHIRSENARRIHEIGTGHRVHGFEVTSDLNEEDRSFRSHGQFHRLNKPRDKLCDFKTTGVNRRIRGMEICGNR